MVTIPKWVVYDIVLPTLLPFVFLFTESSRIPSNPIPACMRITRVDTVKLRLIQEQSACALRSTWVYLYKWYLVGG